MRCPAARRCTRPDQRRGRAAAPTRRQSGVALALVVWFIAGMTLLVAGIVSLARTDTRLAQLHLAAAQATAAADGAINLLLADLLEGRFAGEGQQLAQAQYRLGELQVSVLAIPSGLLIDVNRAGPELLQLAIAGSVSDAASAAAAGNGRGVDARQVADAIVQWRPAQSGARTGAQRFKTLEDVMRVEGVSRAAWDALRDYLAVGFSGSVLPRGGDRAASRTIALLEALSPRRRASRLDLTADPAEILPPSRRGGELRVDAMLRSGGRVWLRRRWVQTAARAGGLPWRYLRTEPARIVTSG